jgi:hypothetical protein
MARARGGRPHVVGAGKTGPVRDESSPLFQVVTIKPRLDRLQEAETQLQSMRRDILDGPGCVFMHLVQPHDEPDTWV